MTARTAVLVWLALSVLLAATIWAAHVPLGIGNLTLSMAIAVAKAALIMLVYMKLWRGRPLEQLAAGTLVLWLAILISLTFVDYLTRADIVATAETRLPAPPAGRTQP